VSLTTAAVALGSNVGDRHAHVAHAVSRLQAILTDARMSQIRETVPVGAPGPQSLYLNAVAIGRTDMSAGDLLTALQAIEQERGRERPFPNAARTLDLDLILFGDAVIDEPNLIVPHPRFRERRFVLEPLAELAPEMRDPVSGLTAGELLLRLNR
jgi:2-amino-4-hydroxy-6-hydroxymethyldihydropteridine diphosphokinase